MKFVRIIAIGAVLAFVGFAGATSVFSRLNAAHDPNGIYVPTFDERWGGMPRDLGGEGAGSLEAAKDLMIARFRQNRSVAARQCDRCAQPGKLANEVIE